MAYRTSHLAEGLKAAREAKRLSQRALSDKVGLPQGHISKIEGGHVDPRLSSLVEMARALDLELMLVPRGLISAVESIVRSAEGQSAGLKPRPAYRLRENEDDA
jgi:HTH-type transcriptional regulator / antitoxin HipB